MDPRAELKAEVVRLLPARRSDGTISLVSRFEGEYPKGDWSHERVPPAALLQGNGPWCCRTLARFRGPSIRLCPLTEPNEEMAPEALMEVWFSFKHKNPHRFITSGARRPAIPSTEKTP